MLKGRQFLAAEIIPVLQAANTFACNTFIGGVDQDPQPTDLAVWRKACGDLTALLVEANGKADADSTGFSYTETSPWWQKVEWSLSSFDGVPQVTESVASLPIDPSPLPGPSWMAPALAVGGLAALVGLGYWWIKR